MRAPSLRVGVPAVILLGTLKGFQTSRDGLRRGTRLRPTRTTGNSVADGDVVRQPGRNVSRSPRRRQSPDRGMLRTMADRTILMIPGPIELDADVLGALAAPQ